MNAYTVKKMVPRLIIAVIAVNLSWYICVALIEIVNALGSSIQDILLAPFSSLNADILGALSFGQTGAITGALLAGAAGVTLFSSWAIFTPVLLGGLLALIVGYVTLVARQVLIVMLTILSPLIIVLWVLPGTSKTAEKSISLYIKLLLMYPIIIALLTSGRIFSAVSAQMDGVLPRVIAMIALFAPYFMIPLVLKFVGGALASIGGMINNRTQGMLDLKRKSAHAKAEQNRAATLGGRRFDDRKMFGLGKYANKAGAYMGRPTMALAGVTKGRMGAAARGEYYLGMEKDRIEALQHLEQHGVKDHDVGNEMGVHWGTDASARQRIKDLRGQGRHDLASRLERVQHLTGERYQLAGMDMANSFGKLDDRAFQALNTIYDDSAFGRMRKQQAWGRIKEQGKGAGNFTTFAAGFNEETGMIETYTNPDGTINQKVADRLAVSLQDAGPGILGQTKQYESLDDNGNVVFDTKAAHMAAIARVAAGDLSLIHDTKVHGERGEAVGKIGDLATSDPQKYDDEVKRRQRKAMEQLVSATMPGAYNDTNTKVAADRAIETYIDTSPEARTLYDDVQLDMYQRGMGNQLQPGEKGAPPTPTGPTLPGRYPPPQLKAPPRTTPILPGDDDFKIPPGSRP